MEDLSPNERRALKDLVEQLIKATDGGTYWLSQIRETSSELRERFNGWLDADDPDPREVAMSEERIPNGTLPMLADLVKTLDEPGAIRVDVTDNVVRLHLADTVITWDADRDDTGAMADVSARLAAALYTVTQLLSYPDVRQRRAHAILPDT